MSQFDWHTEDDASWQEPVQPPKRSAPEPGKRPWLVIGFIVLALVVAGVVVYRQVQQQLESATTAVQEDILSTHNLVQTAVARGDLELFRSQLSGRDPVWTDVEETILRKDLILGREFWGWRQPDPPPDGQPLTVDDLASGFAAIDLSPDLNAAELQFPQAYIVTSTPGVTETVTLTQTAVYRRGSQRWLLSPPDEAFWGGWVTNAGETLVLVYPERDAAVAERLAADLEAMLHELCTTWADLDCPDDLRVTLRLDGEPDSLLTATDWRSFLDEESALQLPAPTLLGLPQDEASYQALYRAYGAQLATAVIADLVGWECCDHALFFQALTDYLLSEIDLRPWPITSADHIRVLRDSVTMDVLNIYWDRREWASLPGEDGWELYTAVDFLLQTYRFINPVQWLRELQSQRSLLNWVNQAFAAQNFNFGSGPGVLDALNEEWWQLAYSQTLLAQERAPLPIPFPEQNMQITCMSDASFNGDAAGEGTTVLYQYDLQADVWTEVLSRTGYLMATPLLHDPGWIMQSFPFSDEDEWWTEIWQDGESKRLLADDKFSLTLGQFDPTGQYLIAYIGALEAEMPQPSLLDLAACQADSCDPLSLPGQPFWSPDGRSTIVLSADLFQGSSFLINGRMMLFDPTQPALSAPLQLGDDHGQLLADGEVIDEGYSPFWVDNQRFGYIRPGATGAGDEVLLAAVDGAEPQVLLTLADITAVGPSGIYAPATIRYVLTHPEQPSLLFVMALDALGRKAYVFSYDLTTQTLDLRLQSPARPFHVLGFSPDGRWLVLTGSEDTDTSVERSADILYVHQIATHDTQTYVSHFASFILSPMFDWSADGEWLLFNVNDRLLSLVAPDHAYQWVFVHELENCSAMSIYWTN